MAVAVVAVVVVAGGTHGGTATAYEQPAEPRKQTNKQEPRSGERGQKMFRNRAARSIHGVCFIVNKRAIAVVVRLFAVVLLCSILPSLCGGLVCYTGPAPGRSDTSLFWEPCVLRPKDPVATVTLTPRLTAFLLLPFSFFLLDVETPHTPQGLGTIWACGAGGIARLAAFFLSCAFLSGSVWEVCSALSWASLAVHPLTGYCRRIVVNTLCGRLQLARVW